MIVARLIGCGKLAGFHFNDSKYGDDDLDSGSIQPYRLFLIFNELVDAARDRVPGFSPAYMLDQSHNVTDPIESLMVSAATLQRTYAQALLVDRAALDAYQDANDALMATQTLKTAFETDVSPIVQRVRLEAGGAIDPVAVYRASGYRQRVAAIRPKRRASAGASSKEFIRRLDGPGRRSPNEARRPFRCFVRVRQPAAGPAALLRRCLRPHRRRSDWPCFRRSGREREGH